jgi:hypothetical protein
MGNNREQGVAMACEFDSAFFHVHIFTNEESLEPYGSRRLENKERTKTPS